jgi:hypothetical protein
VSHKTQKASNVLLELKCGGLLLDRHEPPPTRRFVVYFRTALYTCSSITAKAATKISLMLLSRPFPNARAAPTFSSMVEHRADGRSSDAFGTAIQQVVSLMAVPE